MRRLVDIALLFKEYILFAVCLVLSLFLLALNDTPQIKAIRSITVAGVGMLQDLAAVVPNYFDLAEENRILRERNLALADEVSRLREGRLENIRLRQLLELKERSPHRYVAAKVVAKNLQLLRNTVTLDVGTDDGVQVSMPIVTDAGLVGRVVAVSNRYAIGQVLLNIDFRASAKVQRGRVDGIVMWEGGTALKLKHVAKTLDVQVGDAVITSDYSSMFPAGIRIGVVSRTSQQPGALVQDVDIEPSVDFTRLEEVFVIAAMPDSSRILLEQRASR